MKTRISRTCLTMMGVILFGGSARLAPAQTGPAISTLTPLAGASNGKLSISLPIENSGSGAAGGIQVTSATLGIAALLAPSLPFAVGDLAPSASYTLMLSFDASRLTSGNKYLLTLRGTYTNGSATLGFSINRFITYVPGPFGQPPNPLTVAPTLDKMHSVTQFITAGAGGSITAIGADGSSFTLSIPAKALLSDESITMTPVSAVGNLPISGGLLAGVQFAPDGLEFQQPATLTIQPAVNVPIGQQVGFGYHGNGQEFHFQPLGLSSTITISLMHFSGAGVGQGSAANAGTPTSPFDQLLQQLWQIEDQQRQCAEGGACDPNYPQDVEDLLQQFYQQVVAPLVQAALTDDSQADNAIFTAASWAQIVALLSFDGIEPFSTEVNLILSEQIPAILTNVYNNAFNRCMGATSQAQRIVETDKMIWSESNMQLRNSGFPNFNLQIAACLAGQQLKLFFDSTIDGTSTVSDFLTESVLVNSTVSAQQIPLTFDTSSLTYFGEGQLSYVSHLFTVQWDPSVGTDCGSHGVGNSGTLSTAAAFNLNVIAAGISNPNQLRLNVAITPNVSEADTMCLRPIPTQSDPSPAPIVLPTITYSWYDTLLQAIHSENTVYTVNLNTTQTFDLAGTSAGVATVSAHETSTVTLQQANP